MKGTKIYIDSRLKDEIKRDLYRAFEAAKKAVTMLSKQGFTINRENVSDCILMSKESRQGNPVENQIFIGEADNRVLLYECLYSFGHCANLDAEFNKKLENSLKSTAIPVIRREQEAKAKEDYDRFRSEIYSLFHPSIGTEIDAHYLLQWFDVVGGEVTLPDNINDLLEEAASIYCEGERAEKAFELHRQAARAIEDFISLFRKEIHPSDVGELFFIADGKIYPVEINYNKLL